MWYINTTRNKRQYFRMYRVSANSLTVRTCSTYHASGGTMHNVIGGYYHGSYDPNTVDYEVAVLQVCTEFNMQIDSGMCVCVCDVFAVIFRFISFLGAFDKLRKATLTLSCLSAWRTSAPKGRIFLKIEKCGLLKNR